MIRKESSPLDANGIHDRFFDDEPAEQSRELVRALTEQNVDAMVSQPCFEIRSTDTIGHAVRTMSRLQTACLIVTEDGRMVGILTERDILERVAERFDKIAEDPVSDVMTVDPEVVYSVDPAATAVASIAVSGHRHVPVLGMDDRLVGVVAPRKVFEFIDRYCDR